MSDITIEEVERRQARRDRGLPLHGTDADEKAAVKVKDDRLEREIQADVCKLYRAYGFIVRVLVQYRRSKVAPGIADLYCVNPRTGHVVWHEVKTPTGRQSPAQKAFQEDHIGTSVHYAIGGEIEAKYILSRLGFMDG